MIIIDKIITKYNKEEIYKLLPRITARNIIFNRKELIKAGVLAKYISFDEIGYTLDDYISDYKADKKYKEVKYVFEILRSGKNIGQDVYKRQVQDLMILGKRLKRTSYMKRKEETVILIFGV